ncbi:hypothetical protein, partial [Porticoccus sp.]
TRSNAILFISVMSLSLIQFHDIESAYIPIAALIAQINRESCIPRLYLCRGVHWFPNLSLATRDNLLARSGCGNEERIRWHSPQWTGKSLIRKAEGLPFTTVALRQHRVQTRVKQPVKKTDDATQQRAGGIANDQADDCANSSMAQDAHDTE